MPCIGLKGPKISLGSGFGVDMLMTRVGNGSLSLRRLIIVGTGIGVHIYLICEGLRA